MIVELVRRARRRLLWNVILAHMAVLASVVAGCVILLLMMGTRILDWRLLAAAALAAFVTYVWRAARKMPSPYRTAQVIDRRLRLEDSLSTALFFESAPVSHPASPMLLAQRAKAERLAATVDLDRAAPFEIPRSAYVMGALGLVASGLFALRYGIEPKLDLHAPMARVVMQSLGWSREREERAGQRPGNRKAPDLPKAAGMSLSRQDPEKGPELDAAPDSALNTTAVPDLSVNGSSPESPGKSKSESAGQEKATGEQGDPSDLRNASGNDVADGEGSEQQASERAAPSGGRPAAGSPGENSSLMAKLRDAMSNLMSRMRQPSNAQQSAAKPAGSQQARTQGSGAKSNEKEDASKQADGQPAEGQDGSDSADPENGQGAQGHGTSKSADQQPSNQPGSGIGRQDGNKDTKLAEQLAAMGKISEIIGKRSASVTGEVSIEVQSGNQQLRTPYSRNNAAHTDAGGEISRDEVPLVFQQYVQQYFAEVRKQAGRGKTAKTQN